jgi:hypothetical protein
MKDTNGNIKTRNADTYNTNLASEYLLMSLLCRAGKDAYLSLGNKKGVDIIVKTKMGSICILEVKGVNKRNDWLISNSGKYPVEPNLFYALVCFHGKIEDLTASADFWLIPSTKLAEISEHKISKNEKTIYVSNKRIRESYENYQNSFKWLEEYLKKN